MCSSGVDVWYASGDLCDGAWRWPSGPLYWSGFNGGLGAPGAGVGDALASSLPVGRPPGVSCGPGLVWGPRGRGVLYRGGWTQLAGCVHAQGVTFFSGV